MPITSVKGNYHRLITADSGSRVDAYRPIASPTRSQSRSSEAAARARVSRERESRLISDSTSSRCRETSDGEMSAHLRDAGSTPGRAWRSRGEFPRGQFSRFSISSFAFRIKTIFFRAFVPETRERSRERSAFAVAASGDDLVRANYS